MRKQGGQPKDEKYTPAVLAKMRQLWDDGHSVSDIAQQLGRGYTKNAVMGKIHRLGFPPRPSPIKTDGVRKEYIPRAKRETLPPTPPPQPPTGPRPATSFIDTPQPVRWAADRDKYYSVFRRITECCWPEGSGRNLRMCSKPTHPGSSWCPEHRKIATVPSKPLLPESHAAAGD